MRLVLAAAPLVFAACGGGNGDAAETDSTNGSAPVATGSEVIATMSIWADITRQVACDDTLTVRSLIPAGVDAHGYEPSLQDREALDDAALVVANGLGLESLLDDTLAEVTAGGTPVFEAGDHITPIEGDDDEHDDEHGEAHGVDPHLWFDPTRVAEAVPALGDALVEAGADRAATDECVTTTVSALTELDAEVAGILAVVPPERRLLVTNHDTLGYLADRYDFTVIGSVLPSSSTLAEASPGELEALGEEIEAAGVPAIFVDFLGASADARALAERLGVEVVELPTDALGDAGSGFGTYAEFMRHDAELIAAALGPES